MDHKSSIQCLYPDIEWFIDQFINHLQKKDTFLGDMDYYVYNHPSSYLIIPYNTSSSTSFFPGFPFGPPKDPTFFSHLLGCHTCTQKESRNSQGSTPKKSQNFAGPFEILSYPLVNCHILPWKVTIFYGNIHYFYGHFQLLC